MQIQFQDEFISISLPPLLQLVGPFCMEIRTCHCTEPEIEQEQEQERTTELEGLVDRQG